MEKTLEILRECTVEGQNVSLPQVQLERDEYLKVASKLKKIGGKWKGGKVQAFIFDYDPTDLLAEIAGGTERNLKKEFQFFETPPELVTRLIDLADIFEGDSILEPSAGKGAILEQLVTFSITDCCEINELFHPRLREIPGVHFCQSDFLKYQPLIGYDRIVANPPFSENQDIDHIRHMYECLAPGGLMVSIASTHWMNSQNKKETTFREWLKQVSAKISEVERGAFKKSGTNVGSVIIQIDKEESEINAS